MPFRFLLRTRLKIAFASTSPRYEKRSRTFPFSPVGEAYTSVATGQAELTESASLFAKIEGHEMRWDAKLSSAYTAGLPCPDLTHKYQKQMDLCYEFNQRPFKGIDSKFGWLRGLDLNQRPLGYEPNELPGCSTPHSQFSNSAGQGQSNCGIGDRSPEKVHPLFFLPHSGNLSVLGGRITSGGLTPVEL